MGPGVRRAARDVEIFAHGQLGEDAAVLRHEADAGARDPMGGQPVMSVPFQSTWPADGGVRPMMARMVVVLPTPLRPSRQTHSPWRTSSEMPNSTREGP